MKHVQKVLRRVIAITISIILLLPTIGVFAADTSKPPPIHYTGKQSANGVMAGEDEYITMIYFQLADGGYEYVTYDQVYNQLVYAGVDVNNMQSVSPAKIAKAIITDGPVETDISGSNMDTIDQYVTKGYMPLLTVSGFKRHQLLLSRQDSEPGFWFGDDYVDGNRALKTEIYKAYVAGGSKALALLPKKMVAKPVTVQIDGAPLSFAANDVQPYIDSSSGRVMVPMRKIFEALGATLNWDGNTKTITATKNGTTIIMQIGSKTMTVNGAKTALDSAPVIKTSKTQSSTMIPLRAVSEALGCTVDWDAADQIAKITD